MAQLRHALVGMRLWHRTVRWVRNEPTVVLVVVGACGSALAAGTLPELVALLPGGVATLVCAFLVGLIALALAWAASNSKEGLGVVVFLGITPNDPMESGKMQGFVSSRRDRHLKLFYVNGDYLADNTNKASRVRIAQRVLHARLMEESVGKNGPVDFYLRCDFLSAFDLARSAFARSSDDSMPLGGLGHVRVRQFVNNAVEVDPEVVELENNRWSIRLLSTPTDDGITVTSHQPLENRDAGADDRCALIVSLLGDQTTVGEARRAAGRVDTSTGYVVDENDRCGSEVVIRASLGDRQVSHQAIVSAVVDEWHRFVESRPDSTCAEGRLFVRGPVAIVFSLGALLPESVKLIPYTNR